MSDPKRPIVESPPKTADERARELIGQAIRLRREKAGLSQQQAAEKIGISRDTLVQWEKGKGSLWTGGDAGCTDLTMMRKLKSVYAASFQELLPRNQYPSAPLDPELRRQWVAERNRSLQQLSRA